VNDHWSEAAFDGISGRMSSYEFSVHIGSMNLIELKTFVLQKRDFLLRLLENPTVLEHESFTELLRAVFHLTEELESRDDVTSLPKSDYAHLSGDIRRAYDRLARQWIEYMKYLKGNYPYLFSLAMRTNPFDRDASPIVK